MGCCPEKRHGIIVGILCLIIIAQWIWIGRGSLFRDLEPGSTKRVVVTESTSSRQESTRRAQPPQSQLGADLEPLARVWKHLNDSSWCIQRDEVDAPQGFWYVKITKTGSSTMAGVTIRIAQKMGQRKWPNTNTSCFHRFKHGRKKQAVPRHGPGILWTFLRDPMARGISDFYHFQVSRRNVTPTDDNLLMNMKLFKSFQLLYAAGYKYGTQYEDIPWDKGTVAFLKERVLDKYDFLGLVERRWESLAVMKILWGLETSDLIVLSSKRSGGYDDGQFEHRCVAIQKSPPFHKFSQRVQDYIQDEFPRQNHDYGLYAIANRSLDLTIDAIGRDVVDQEIRLLRAAQAYADEQCLHTAVFPCSSNGTRQIQESRISCYNGDSGCGHACTDEVLRPGYQVPKEYFSR